MMKEQGIAMPPKMAGMGVASAVPKGIVGPVMSDGGGRSDDVSASLQENSYVIPAMIVSALGQGNTEAGMRILTEMFGAGEENEENEGESDDVDAMVSGGEFVIPAKKVAAIGDGDPEAGANVLDQFIMGIRGKHAAMLQNAPEPV